MPSDCLRVCASSLTAQEILVALGHLGAGPNELLVGGL
jgi:hypothetical protein